MKVIFKVVKNQVKTQSVKGQASRGKKKTPFRLTPSVNPLFYLAHLAMNDSLKAKEA